MGPTAGCTASEPSRARASSTSPASRILARRDGGLSAGKPGQAQAPRLPRRRRRPARRVRRLPRLARVLRPPGPRRVAHPRARRRGLPDRRLGDVRAPSALPPPDARPDTRLGPGDRPLRPVGRRRGSRGRARNPVRLRRPVQGLGGARLRPKGGPRDVRPSRRPARIRVVLPPSLERPGIRLGARARRTARRPAREASRPGPLPSLWP